MSNRSASLIGRLIAHPASFGFGHIPDMNDTPEGKFLIVRITARSGSLLTISQNHAGNLA